MQPSSQQRYRPYWLVAFVVLCAYAGSACTNPNANDEQSSSEVAEFVESVPDGWFAPLGPQRFPTLQAVGDPSRPPEPEEYSISFRVPPSETYVLLCLYKSEEAADGLQTNCRSEVGIDEDPNWVRAVLDIEPNWRLADQSRWTNLRLACNDLNCTSADLEQVAAQWNAPLEQ